MYRNKYYVIEHKKYKQQYCNNTHTDGYAFVCGPTQYCIINFKKGSEALYAHEMLLNL